MWIMTFGFIFWRRVVTCSWFAMSPAWYVTMGWALLGLGFLFKEWIAVQLNSEERRRMRFEPK